VLLEQLDQHRLGGPSVCQQLFVGQRRQVGAGGTQGDGGDLGDLDVGELGRRHQPAHMGEDLVGQFGLLVVGMRDVRRHFGVIAEKGQVKLVNGDGRVADALHPHVRQVDIEVATEEPGGLGPHLGHLALGIQALANVAITPTKHDAVVPGEGLAQRRGRRR
jgi:hypothetical protein